MSKICVSQLPENLQFNHNSRISVIIKTETGYKITIFILVMVDEVLVI